MKYNKYVAPKGKVLFNTEDFTYGNTILSAYDLNLIILEEAEAKSLSNAYRNEQDKFKEEEQQNTKIESNEEEQPVTFANKTRSNIATMVLNDAGEYEEIEEDKDPLIEFKKEKLIELLAKGVNMNPEINKIKVNTKYI